MPSTALMAAKLQVIVELAHAAFLVENDPTHVIPPLNQIDEALIIGITWTISNPDKTIAMTIRAFGYLAGFFEGDFLVAMLTFEGAGQSDVTVLVSVGLGLFAQFCQFDARLVRNAEECVQGEIFDERDVELKPLRQRVFCPGVQAGRAPRFRCRVLRQRK